MLNLRRKRSSLEPILGSMSIVRASEPGLHTFMQRFTLECRFEAWVLSRRHSEARDIIGFLCG